MTGCSESLDIVVFGRPESRLLFAAERTNAKNKPADDSGGATFHTNLLQNVRIMSSSKKTLSRGQVDWQTWECLISSCSAMQKTFAGSNLSFGKGAIAVLISDPNKVIGMLNRYGWRV
ncbi:hypothetical protein WM40_17430 [Robbsia andropogonis]|uniref:Uncharacterized protein n=1 Tax=Robbsia andropogonis TaxID=28092 RepID=A0A0F5JXP6_9BURK|nr:hypothetical protein [Robbsia andropogonis]KKB62419.1 hypothetical protein WM40_17430 [Robbsia andropogonis]MCP1120005.1 hypothetical protein [Robbsia andropogonis]MCP1129936.1 hypothetical protein [Robbsia andropogonis]